MKLNISSPSSASPHRKSTKAMKKFPLSSILIVCALRGTLFLGAGLLLVQPCAGAPGGFENTGSLSTARAEHAATLLPNGLVLVAGGFDSSNNLTASAELYDSSSGTWSLTGDLNIARYLHTATLLPNGMVLVAGGRDSSVIASASAELYDPASGTWTVTGNLNTARAGHTATLLPNGLVLVAGGVDGTNNLTASAELYDSSSGTWTVTGSLNTARDLHTATLLPNGLVLVAGGVGDRENPSASAELYDSSRGTWSLTGDLNIARYLHTATLLPNGMVLVAGGEDSNFSTSASAELYDPTGGTWTVTGSLNTARYLDTATLLPNGTVLVAGGFDSSSNPTASAELYDSSSGTWSLTGDLNIARYLHTATLLPNGMVLVAGGRDSSSNVSASAELYDPALQPPLIISPLAATGTVSLPFSYQFEATGATSLAVGDLPGGLSFDPTLRAIVGNPTAQEMFQIALTASNSAGTTNANLVLTSQPLPATGPVIISVTSAKGRTGSPFNFQVITSGGSALTRLTATGLPSGLTADSMTGEISGTVTTDGSFSVTLSATDVGITNTASLELTFTSDLAVPVIVSQDNALLYPGVSFSYAIMAPNSDTSDQVIYSVVGQLPAGLGLDQTTGIISGIPTLRFGLQPSPQLSGGVVTNVQIFACNASGCAAQGLFFLLPTGAANISTRLDVGTGDNVLIGGFITQGNAPMKLVLRGIGPSLPVTGPLADPFLELHDRTSTIATNDNWKVNLAGGSQEVAIENTGIAPTNDLESAILAVLNPGIYTAILRGTNNGTGVGLVEVYNLGAASLDVSSAANLANISTRGNVQTGDNVMIGGFINEGAIPIKVLLRAIGPSLSVTGKLADPTLELHQNIGGTDTIIATNDNWMTDPAQKADIMATTIPPTNALESAIAITLPVGEGHYTAIVKGVNGTTGVALVEAYFGNPVDGCLGTLCP
jgi:hypothetical protein